MELIPHRKTPPGFLIDVTTGRWLKESDGEDPPGEAGLDDADKVRRKQRVIPYVEDQRNILVTRQTGRIPEETEISCAIALERGIEAAFQLEDSELSPWLGGMLWTGCRAVRIAERCEAERLARASNQ